MSEMRLPTQNRPKPLSSHAKSYAAFFTAAPLPCNDRIAFLKSGSSGEATWPGGGACRLLQIVKRSHIVGSFLHGRRDALRRNRFASRACSNSRSVKISAEPSSRLNHLLGRSRAESAIANRLAAVIIGKRSRENFRGASRAA